MAEHCVPCRYALQWKHYIRDGLSATSNVSVGLYLQHVWSCCKAVLMCYTGYSFALLAGSGPSGPSSGITSPALIPIPSHSVPDFSYSSSEDEFYDADEFYQSSTSPKHCMECVSCAPPFYQRCINQILLGTKFSPKFAHEFLLFGCPPYLCFLVHFHSLHLLFSPSGPSAASLLNNEETALKRPDTTESLNSSMSNGTTDAGKKVKRTSLTAVLFQPRDTPLVLISELFDSHDDRDDDPEGESVEEHKSVIMHLLSQVRLGMDLTKVNIAVQHADLSSCRVRDCAVTANSAAKWWDRNKICIVFYVGTNISRF